MEEEKLINEYIQKKFVEKWVIKYSILFKAGIIFLFIFAWLLYILHVTFNEISEEMHALRFKNTILFNSFIAISWWIIHFSPKNISLVIPCFILVTSIVFADFLTFKEEYEFDEYISTVFCWIYLLATMFPHSWKLSCASLTIGSLYMSMSVFKKYTKVPIQFYASFFFNSFYFWVLCYIVNYRLKELYKTIHYNENLITQNKKVVEVFPHGVIIENTTFEERNNICFANKEFTSQIRNIRSRIEELENIEVTLPDSSNNEPSKDFKTHLLECFKIHSLNPKNKQNLAHELTGVKVRCCLDPDIALRLDEGGEEDFAERIFNIKSIEVIWERKPWHMHVMIDTTDILKLEEARNNIRCQRIMFTSVSHELRTPLNAILNCYYLISQKLK
jgi:hypothetical protein